MPRVLVVDDDPLVCEAIEACLQRQGFEVTVADGGEAGLHALERAAFDVMLVDVFMPHMRGCESIRIFHERAPTVPLIAMSGYAFANLASRRPSNTAQHALCESRSGRVRWSRPSPNV